jgi:hypothetical protein
MKAPRAATLGLDLLPCEHVRGKKTLLSREKAQNTQKVEEVKSAHRLTYKLVRINTCKTIKK